MSVALSVLMKLISVVLGCLVCTALHATDLPPLLGKLGKQLLSENFDEPEVPRGWRASTGTQRMFNGRLMAAQRESEKHIGAFRHHMDLQDCAVQVDFQLGEARIINLGFDPAAGELKKRGHLLSVVVTKAGWSIVEHNNKADPKSKTKTLAEAKTTFDPTQSYTLLLECKGNDVAAQIAGKETLRASSPDFHVKKPGLVFRMGGADGKEAAFDNVKVWELK